MALQRSQIQILNDMGIDVWFERTVSTISELPSKARPQVGLESSESESAMLESAMLEARVSDPTLSQPTQSAAPAHPPIRLQFMKSRTGMWLTGQQLQPPFAQFVRDLMTYGDWIQSRGQTGARTAAAGSAAKPTAFTQGEFAWPLVTGAMASPERSVLAFFDKHGLLEGATWLIVTADVAEQLQPDWVAQVARRTEVPDLMQISGDGRTKRDLLVKLSELVK